MMRKHARYLYQPVMPLGKNGTVITGCKAHWDLSREVAIEGTVLLKNDGTLPLKKGSKICLFGRGAGQFLFGGGGSGYVHGKKTVSLADGLREAANNGEIEFFDPLVDFYKKAVREDLENQKKNNQLKVSGWESTYRRGTPTLPADLYEQAKEFGDLAIFCLTRFSSEGNTFGDRSGEDGDFTLYEEERVLFEQLCKDFPKVVVVLNTCGMLSTEEYKLNDKVGAVIYSMYLGGTAGEALTDILLGKRYPSGHLQDTLARTIDDYPSTEGYKGFIKAVDYKEDIFVGYRYFETFKPEAVVYPFGYGLGYTTFAIAKESAQLEKNSVKLAVKVKNTGNFAGKEVVQAYLTAPQGKLGKAKKVLCAFQKTRELQPGEECVVKLSFNTREFGSFDDLGKIVKSAFILEQGEYIVNVGNNVRDTEEYFRFNINEDIICKRCHEYMAPRDLEERLTADGTMEKLPKAEPKKHPLKRYKLKQEALEKPISLTEALDSDQLDAFMAGLTDEEICELLNGHPMANCSNTSGIGHLPREKRFVEKIPLVPTADGPAGLRAIIDCGIKATYFPCANTISQTWNTNFAKKVGKAAALEVKENNIGIWLAPAMNIHRSPMCGRNFEYYSEDPLTSGLFSAATVQGVQSCNVAATIKHFCCNNKEILRKESDSRVSQRALREIYLRGFEICIKKANPWALMTSYNKVNGEQSSANWEAINGVLRGEWGYEGVVMTDWWAFSDIADELAAGSDVKMPERITFIWDGADLDPTPLHEKIAAGKLDRGICLASARRVLKMMDHLD